ncbi:MAG: hypothetical protein IKR82_06160 [Bacteroidales bacterium]|nr:hypothetical protein [Bacteroidales bacterium]
MRLRLIVILSLLYCQLSGQDTLFLKRKALYETPFYKAESYKIRVSFCADSLVLTDKRVASIINKWEALCEGAAQYHHYSLFIYEDHIAVYSTNYITLSHLGRFQGYSVINNKTALIFEQGVGDSTSLSSPVGDDLFTKTNKSRGFSYIERGTSFAWKDDTVIFMPLRPEDDVPSLSLCYKKATCSTISLSQEKEIEMNYQKVKGHYPQTVDRYCIINEVLKNKVDSTIHLFLQGNHLSNKCFYLYNEYQTDGSVILSFYEYPQENSETITCWFYAKHSIIYCCGIPPSYLFRYLEVEKKPIYINTHPYSFRGITGNSTNSPSFIIHYYPSKWYSQETADL